MSQDAIGFMARKENDDDNDKIPVPVKTQFTRQNNTFIFFN